MNQIIHTIIKSTYYLGITYKEEKVAFIMASDIPPIMTTVIKAINSRTMRCKGMETSSCNRLALQRAWA